MNIRIFSEGVADIKFIKDYLSFKYNCTIEKNELIETGGWTKIFSKDGELIINKMMENSNEGGVNLLIFDADADFSDRIKELETWRDDNNLDLDIFLWPNNSENGDFEKTLENIINPNNVPIFDCWDDYENCLKSKLIKGRSNPLTIPAKKTKIYGYLEALLGDSKSQKKLIKEENRDYKNFDFWNLDSDYLIPFRTYLDNYFNS